jgi:hypothetical protein
MVLERTQQQRSGQSQSQPQQRRLATGLSIVSINGNESTTAVVIDIPGESMVRVVAKTTADIGGHIVLAAIGAAIPGDDIFKDGVSSRLWPLPHVNGDYFFAGWVPLAKLAFHGATVADTNFLKVAVCETDGTVTESAERPFFAQIKDPGGSLAANVDARNAVWFAFANHDFPPPGHTMTYGEADSVVSPRINPTNAADETGDRCVYRPQFYLVPEGTDLSAADALSIEPPSESRKWRHGPGVGGGCEANYKGRPSTSTRLDLGKKAEYQSPQLNSSAIQDESCDLISLLYMWHTPNSGSNSVPQQLARQATMLRLGILCINPPVPTGAKQLFFAAHDSFEWSNNQESVTFTLKWKKAP